MMIVDYLLKQYYHLLMMTIADFLLIVHCSLKIADSLKQWFECYFPKMRIVGCSQRQLFVYCYQWTKIVGYYQMKLSVYYYQKM